MKNKKILTATLISALALSAAGCSTGNYKLAKNINKSVDGFVSSINNLDYVETSSNGKIGKVIQTSTESSEVNENTPEIQIENDITRPEDRTDNFKLYYLTDIPYISLTTDDDGANFSIELKFSTEKIENVSNDISEQINKLIIKRSILMIYVNEIYNGNVNLSGENKTAINAYVNVIKENASFLNGNRGMVKNQLGMASNLVSSKENENLINYYIIKSGEALETRSAKIDSAINAIDSIIEIIENNLTENSCYYNSSLSDTYSNIISNFSNSNTAEINENSSNKEIAETIADCLLFNKNTNNNSTNQTIDENSNSNGTTNQEQVENNKDNILNTTTDSSNSINKLTNTDNTNKNTSNNFVQPKTTNSALNQNNDYQTKNNDDENNKSRNSKINKNEDLTNQETLRNNNKKSINSNKSIVENMTEKNIQTKEKLLDNKNQNVENKIIENNSRQNNQPIHNRDFVDNQRFVSHENQNFQNFKKSNENYNNFVSNPNKSEQRPEIVPFRNI